MNTTKMNKHIRLLLLPPCMLVTASGLFAQAASSSEINDEKVITLSPFEVSGDSDVGYQATSTLAGTRLRTDLRDIGSSISIVNEEFLRDTGSKNLEDVLIFTPNTEIGGLGGNHSGSTGANPIPEGQRDDPSGGLTRVRGLASADLTRDYFITNIPFDTFNVALTRPSTVSVAPVVLLTPRPSGPTSSATGVGFVSRPTNMAPLAPRCVTIK
jgi:outer membrane receptor for monomeric catechols